MNLERIHAWSNDREIQELSDDSVEDVPIGHSERRTARWVENADPSQRHYAIHLRDVNENGDNRFIGFAHLVFINPDHGTCKIGIVIGERDCWDLGLGTEALRELVRFAFVDLKLRRISAEAYATNLRSWRMLERVGFMREGVAREAVNKGGELVDEYAYGLLKREWNPPT